MLLLSPAAPSLPSVTPLPAVPGPPSPWEELVPSVLDLTLPLLLPQSFPTPHGPLPPHLCPLLLPQCPPVPNHPAAGPHSPLPIGDVPLLRPRSVPQPCGHPLLLLLACVAIPPAVAEASGLALWCSVRSLRVLRSPLVLACPAISPVGAVDRVWRYGQTASNYSISGSNGPSFPLHLPPLYIQPPPHCLSSFPYPLVAWLDTVT